LRKQSCIIIPAFRIASVIHLEPLYNLARNISHLTPLFFSYFAVAVAVIENLLSRLPVTAITFKSPHLNFDSSLPAARTSLLPHHPCRCRRRLLQQKQVCGFDSVLIRKLQIAALIWQ
jgi:hypothetical protein